MSAFWLPWIGGFITGFGIGGLTMELWRRYDEKQ